MSIQRSKRISEEIKKVVSSLLRNGLKDPRISPMASVTDVKTTRDLRFAYIYITVFGDDKNKEETIEGLNKAKGYIRKQIGSEINLRYTPEPVFKLDETIESAMHIDSIIKQVSTESKKEEEVSQETLDNEFWEDEDE